MSDRTHGTSGRPPSFPRTPTPSRNHPDTGLSTTRVDGSTGGSGDGSGPMSSLSTPRPLWTRIGVSVWPDSPRWTEEGVPLLVPHRCLPRDGDGSLSTEAGNHGRPHTPVVTWGFDSSSSPTVPTPYRPPRSRRGERHRENRGHTILRPSRAAPTHLSTTSLVVDTVGVSPRDSCRPTTGTDPRTSRRIGTNSSTEGSYTSRAPIC